MVNNFEPASKLRIFIFEGMKAMRTGRYNFPNAVTVQRSDIFRHQRLSQVFVSHPPRGVSGTFFLEPENSKLHAGMFHQSCKRLGHLAVAGIVGSGTTRPKEDVNLRSVRGLRDVKPFGPVCAGRMTESPRREIAFKVIKRSAESDGNRDSFSTRPRRISTISSTCSIVTGHLYTHAIQVVQAHNSSSLIN